jgi:hypothetical protein
MQITPTQREGVANYFPINESLARNPIANYNTSHPRLKRIASATDAQIVLSSHWRKNPAITNYLFYAFEKLGIPIAVDKTPDLCYDVSCRAKEIHRWMQEHPKFKGNWVVLGEEF